MSTTPHGLLLVNTGNGKGKSTAAFGVAFRAIGQGLNVSVIQFIKGKGSHGAKGADIRKHHPKVGPDIKGFVQKHAGQKLKTTGVKATMRYFAG